MLSKHSIKDKEIHKQKGSFYGFSFNHFVYDINKEEINGLAGKNF